MNIILFGFKSCGKTFLGSLLALKLMRPFIDTDEEVEKLYFQRKNKSFSCREIFQKEGESFFRELEKEIIFSLKNRENAVIALGGGALNEKTLPFLSQIGELLYLKASLALVLKRIKKKKLPAFAEKENQPFQAIQRLFYERDAFFKKIKTKELSADMLENPEKLHAIIAKLQEAYAGK